MRPERSLLERGRLAGGMAGGIDGEVEEKFTRACRSAGVHHEGRPVFPVYDNAGKLLPNFIFVANISRKDPTRYLR